jgi:hypothetical protein
VRRLRGLVEAIVEAVEAIVEAVDDARDTTPHACARWCLPARSYARTLHAGLTSIVGRRPN